jgi:prolyl oligopeptidase
MKHVRVALALLLGICHSFAQSLRYPPTEKGTTVDSYFGVKVPDPYRWLEDDTAKAVADWVMEQNKVTFGYLSQIPFREKLKSRLEQLYNYPKYSAPFRKGKYYIFSKNDGLQNQAVHYIQKGLRGVPEVLIDPNTLSSDGTVRLASLNFSDNAKYLAYGISRGGSDWREFFVMDVKSRKLLNDHVRWGKFSGAQWLGNGFYYSKYDPPADTAKFLSAKNENHKIYYHRLGTPQSADELVFEDKAHPLRFHSLSVTDDKRFLVLYISDRGSGKKGNALWVRDLKKKETAFKPVIESFDDTWSLIDNVGGKLLLATNHNAPNQRIVMVDPDKPQEAEWKTMVPERAYTLDGAATGGGKLFVTYTRDVAHRVVVFSLNGKEESEIVLPTLGTTSGLSGNADDKVLFYTFTSFTFPTNIYKYDIQARKSELYRSSEVKFNPNDYETRQIFYTSKDGTRVPMFITHKKGIMLDGNNPTLLYGYGGFNVTVRPSFNSLLIALLEQGVVYCVANIRGGGEYGEKWHEAGTKLQKQNVFDDFVAAAEWLIANKYTSPHNLALQGGSNGGLLVGAMMCQRPELFKVALPAVGVMDMLRYHSFTIGWNWKPDYGSSEDSAQFVALYKYSPLHNLKSGVHYPATLITTADHDDRVVPAHSFKFAATLQENHRGANPVLIRIDTKSGHGASNTKKQIETTADVYSFLLYNLGVTVP